MLTMKYISVSRETLKLLSNIQIILYSYKIQLIQQKQFYLSYNKENRIICSMLYVLYFTSSLRNFMHSSLVNQIVHIFTC